MIDDDIRKKYDLRSTAGKEAAEEDQVERDEHLKIFRKWAIANNRDPEEMTMEALGEFEKDQLEKKETKERRSRKSVLILVLYIMIYAFGERLFTLLNLDQDGAFADSAGIAMLVSAALSFWLTQTLYRTLNMGSWFKFKFFLIFLLCGAIVTSIKETDQTKPTSVPSEAVTEKDSSVGVGTDAAGHYEHPDAFAGAVTEKDSSVGVSPDDTFKEDQDLKAIEADECAEWDNMDRTWLIMNCTRDTLAQLISSWGANESEDAFNDLLMDFEEKGDIEIRNKLAEMYYLGARPLTSGTANALFQTFKSIAGHNVEAQSNLGLMYSVGSGVGKDLDEALKWDQRAADQGDEDAKKRLLRKERYQPDYDGP